MSLSQATKLLPTPVAQAPGNTAEAHLRKKPGRTQVTDLGIIARENLFAAGGNLLPTPQATTATYSSNGYGPNLHETAGTLRDSFGPYAPAVAHWETITGRTAPARQNPLYAREANRACPSASSNGSWDSPTVMSQA